MESAFDWEAKKVYVVDAVCAIGDGASCIVAGFKVEAVTQF